MENCNRVCTFRCAAHGCGHHGPAVRSATRPGIEFVRPVRCRAWDAIAIAVIAAFVHLRICQNIAQLSSLAYGTPANKCQASNRLRWRPAAAAAAAPAPCLQSAAAVTPHAAAPPLPPFSAAALPLPCASPSSARCRMADSSHGSRYKQCATCASIACGQEGVIAGSSMQQSPHLSTRTGWSRPQAVMRRAISATSGRRSCVDGKRGSVIWSLMSMYSCDHHAL